MSDDEIERQIWLVRHGETEWARLGRHTGRTDIPLTETGREQARSLGRRLVGRSFALVAKSPLSRAADTAALAGFGRPQLRLGLAVFVGRAQYAVRGQRAAEFPVRFVDKTQPIEIANDGVIR